ncbi:MAG: ComF family protein [Coriobacteriales bacterium]|nr:ComF family protein [Coriobacteriales bacterium]
MTARVRRLQKPVLSFLKEGLAETLWPTRCVGCDAPGSLLCPDCTQKLPYIEQMYACKKCGAPYGYLVCTECSGCVDREEIFGAEPTPERFCELDGMCCYGEHEWPLDRLVRTYKDWSESRLADILGRFIADALRESDGLARLDLQAYDAVCFVPATPQAYARRGFDHMEPIAKNVAGLLGKPCLDVLARRSHHDQRSLSRAERSSNVSGSMVSIKSLTGLSFICIDDVLTTGATIREAARTLKEAGASLVFGATAVRVW